jgi:hypothetical protein
MDREKKEKIAVFRFGVIFPLVGKRPPPVLGRERANTAGAGQQGMGNSLLYPDIHQQSNHPGLGKTLRRWRAEDRGAVPRTPGRQGTDEKHYR